MVDEGRHLMVDRASVAAEVMEGEAVIINVATGTYYSTEGVGGWIWERLVEGSTVAGLATELTRHYAVGEGLARTDVAAFAAELLAERLVIEAAGPAAAVAAGAGGTEAREPYVAPRLNTFRDMRDLLALDPPMPSLDPEGWTAGPAAMERKP